MSDINKNKPKKQHVHEILGSTRIAGCCSNAHSHRFATVSDVAIYKEDGSHVHEVKFRTDSCNGHFHEFSGISSKNIEIGNGRHVHMAKAHTTENAGHKHEFLVASLIDDPTCEEDCDCHY